LSSTMDVTYKIVFFDIDGTLVNKRGEIPVSTRESIKRLKESNVEVILSSGRGPSQLKHIAQDLNIDSYVSLTGSYVVYKGKVIYDQPLSTFMVRSLLDFSMENDHPIVYLGKEDVFTSHVGDPDVKETFLNWLKLDYPNFYEPTAVDFPVYQFLLYCPEEMEDVYKKQFSDLHFIRWHPLSSEITPRGGSKAKGIDALLNYLGLTSAEAVAFGDALNDREMLSLVGMGIAMGNAHEALKPFAKFTTKHIDDDGVYFGLKKIGLI